MGWSKLSAHVQIEFFGFNSLVNHVLTGSPTASESDMDALRKIAEPPPGEADGAQDFAQLNSGVWTYSIRPDCTGLLTDCRTPSN